MAPHSSTLAWKIPWTQEPSRLQSMGSLRIGHDWSDFTFTFMHWRRKWQPTPVFLPGESQGQGTLVGCRLWGRRVGHDWSDLAAAAACCLVMLSSGVLNRIQSKQQSFKCCLPCSFLNLKLAHFPETRLNQFENEMGFSGTYPILPSLPLD